MKYLLLIFCCALLSAQTTIKGKLQSSDQNPLSRANIILLDKNGNIDTYALSSADGSFSMVTNSYGDFTVEINAMGHISAKQKVSFIRRGTTIDLKTLALEKINTKDIKEVVITRSNPIKIKKDTVEYTASKFTNGTEQNAEDLLKKLPGVTVLNDGKIKVGDKEVERVMVENDDLFERGYQTLTKNMPTKPVEKVQILKNYSKNKLLKGVEKSEGVAINLTLKEDAKDQWFGNVYLASTSYIEDMRQGKINLMNFSKRKKIYLLYNANNLGLNEMNGVSYLINPESNKTVENVGNEISTLSMLNLHQKNYSFGDERTNFNNDQLASINYIYNFKKDWKLKAVTIYNTTENRNYTDSYYRFNYGGTAFANSENKTWKQNNRNVVGKLEISKENKKSNLVFYTKFSSLNEDNDNQFIFNSVPNFQKGDNRLTALENRLVYTKKIDSSQALVAVARYIHQNRPYRFFEDNNLASIISGNPLAKIMHQELNSGLEFGGVKLSWLNNFSKDQNLQIQTGTDLRKHQLSSNLQVLDANNQALIFDHSLYQNDVDFRKNQIFNQIDYNLTWKKDWKLTAQVFNQYLWTEFNQNKKEKLSVSPSFNLSYGTFRFGTLSINASKRYSTTEVDNLYTGYIYQGNRYFKSNDLDFALMPSYNAGITYNRGDQLTRNLMLSVSYTKNENYLSSKSIINPNYSFYQSILVNDSSLFMSMLELKRYIKFIKSRISINTTYTQSDYKSSVNNQPMMKTKFSNLKTGFEMKSGFLFNFNYELGYDWNFSFVKTEMGNNNYLNQKGFVNLYYNLSKTVVSKLKYEYYKSGNSNQKNTQFLDFNLNYNSAKYKAGFFIQANNLLNTKEILTYSLDNVSESAYIQRLLPLHIVVGINKSF